MIFDLEGLYVWWMQTMAEALHPSEDVDDPREEKMTFLVHEDLESFEPLARKEPYYDPSGQVRTSKGGINVARTFYADDGARPEELFELGTQSLIYSTLVLGDKKSQPCAELRRHAFWVELGLAHWAAQHAGGGPGHPRFRTALDGSFALDWDVARRTLEAVSPPHPLLRTRHEVTNLIGLSQDDFVGSSANVPLCKARCASFVSFLIETDPPLVKGKKTVGAGRETLWHYFREVYGTPAASSSSAFEDELAGAKLESLEQPWKDWARRFSSVVGNK